MSEFHFKLMSGQNQDTIGIEGMEIHVLSSATKPLCSWTSRDIIQDCRESCGGHGYLKSMLIVKQIHIKFSSISIF